MKTEKLLIKCFDKWWRASIEVRDDFNVITASSIKALSPHVRMHATVIYNETCNNFIVNDPGVSPETMQLQIWMTKEKLPKLPLERKAFNRLVTQDARHRKYD